MDLEILLERIDFLCSKYDINKTTAFIESGAGKNFAYNIKAGKSPSVEKIAALASYFKVSTDYLLGLTNAATFDSGIELTAIEVRLLAAFRSIPSDERLIWLGKLELLAEQEAEKEYRKEEA